MTTTPLILDTIAQLKSTRVSDKTIVFVVGNESFEDELGGFYRWDEISSLDEDLDFLNVIVSALPGVLNGRWIRVFQHVQSIAQGTLVSYGGVKILFANGVLDANGEISIALTDDNTAMGQPIFKNVWVSTGQGQPSALGTANDVVIGTQKALTSKLITYKFSRGASTSLGSSLLSILGLVIPGLRNAASGTPVTIVLYGLG